VSTKTTAANLNRRRFIQGTGVAALSAGLVAQGPNSAAASVRGKTGFDYDALDIGGGFAGVTAARDLNMNGYS
jgi:hypothetical protein